MLHCNSLARMLLVCAIPLHLFGSLTFEGPATILVPADSLLPVLAIQNTGTASGCVAFLSGLDVMGLAACPGGFTGAGGNEMALPATQTRRIGDLMGAGITSADSLLFLFRPDEGGGPITITDLALTFFDVAGEISFTADLPGAPLSFADTNAVSSPNTAFVFRLDDFESALANDFFSDPENRVGAAATLSGSGGGVATFTLASQSSTTAIPEPQTAVFAVTGVVALALLRSGKSRPVRGPLSEARK